MSAVSALIVAVLDLLIGSFVARRFTRRDPDPRLFKLLMVSLCLHMLGSGAQIIVTDTVYHHIADFVKYLSQGAVLGTRFRSFDFSLAHSGVTDVIGDGSVSIATGVVIALVGNNQLAVFLVFALLSWLGLLLFYRAYTMTFPDYNPRRYALMLFLMPSLLYWTSDASKESIMLLSLGVATYGVARVLARRGGGFLFLALGIGIGVTTRPNELALLLVAFTVAIVLRQRVRRPQSLLVLRRIGTAAFLIVVLAVSGSLTAKFLHSANGASVTSLSSLGKGNSAGQGQSSALAAGFGSSNVPYHSDPLYYPEDIYEVLFDPLPVTAHSGTQLIAAGENMTVLILILISLRQLRCIPRIARVRPYVMVCTVYTLGFLYAFAALGNEGLIVRERTLLFPFMLVLLCLPVAPKGHPPRYPWEVRGATRAQRRAARTAGALAGR